MMAGIKVCIITILFTAIYLIGSVFLSTLIFHGKANGSLIKLHNKIIGSKLIGQEFKSNFYFHGRPSQNNYKNNISGNSNYPFYSLELRKKTKENYNKHLILNFNNSPDLNLITESASGLDPHITYIGALTQIDRISKNTGISKEEIKKLINKNAKSLIFGIFGPKTINVLELNLEINKTYAKATGS